MVRVFYALLAAGAVFAAHPAFAQAPDQGEDGRYSFHRIEDGFLRLDSRSGQVSLCGRKTVGWGCQAVPDERAALENEIARLQGDNAALKKEILSHGLSLPNTIKGDTKADAPVAKRDELELKLPSQAELERMRGLIEKVWRRLVEMIVNLQKDMMQKT